MEITDVRVKLLEDAEDKLRGFCTITFADQFVVRDVKIIEGPSGFFIAMPSRKLTDRCPTCRHKNHLRAKFCNECGGRLDPNRTDEQAGGRPRLHADVAHPISQACRESLQEAVIREFEAELERNGQAAGPFPDSDGGMAPPIAEGAGGGSAPDDA